MSAICAVIARDGSAADPSELQPLLAAARHRGSHVQLRGAGTAAALGAQTHSVADAAACVEVLGELAIAFHGRLDNIDDVRAAVGTAGAGCSEGFQASSGAEAARLVLLAFAQWRERCAERLIGDFAFVIWDHVRRRAYCARDAAGVTPLYYHLTSRRFVAATELTQVLAAGMSLAPCETFVAELLAFEVCSRTDTLYRDVYRLPGGHWMTISDRDVRVEQYWAPDTGVELRYGRDEDYAEHFSELFGRAVADRAPHDARAAAYLSGGLDSSSVVCTAHALGRPLETFSLTFPGVPEADERSYIDAVTQRCGFQNHAIDATLLDAAIYRRRVPTSEELPEMPSDALGMSLLEAMRRRGLPVALTGAGGDYGFAGSFRHYAESLQRGDLGGLIRQIRADRALSDVGWSASELFTSGLRLVLPSAVRRALRPLGRPFGMGVRVPSWIDPSFASRTSLLDRLSAPRTSCQSRSPARAHVSELFESGWTARILEAGDRLAAAHGVELRHPFFDRRLIEFAVALPETQRWRGTTTKFVLREGMRGRLPESVYARADKGDFTAFVPRAVEALGGADALRSLRVAALGWVRSSELIHLYARGRRRWEQGSADYGQEMFPVWMALAVETWYRAMFVKERHERVTADRRPAPSEPERRGQARRTASEAVSVPRAH